LGSPKGGFSAKPLLCESKGKKSQEQELVKGKGRDPASVRKKVGTALKN